MADLTSYAESMTDVRCARFEDPEGNLFRVVQRPDVRTVQDSGCSGEALPNDRDVTVPS
jgi:hypothetical protein